MDGRNEFREGLFPSGFCITPEDGVDTEVNGQAAHQLFNEIDHGDISATKLLLASEACRTCVQLSYCNDQQEDIAAELWRRGVGFTVVGGEEHATNVEMARSTLETSGTAFKFDLTTIPEDPQLALEILRQAKRSGQLAGSQVPKGAVQVGEQYTDWMQATKPQTLSKLQKILGETETTKGIHGIATALFKQKDFADFSQGIPTGVRGRGKNRYNSSRIDPELDYPKITQFLADAAAIKELGYSAPTRKAAVHGPAFYKELAETYRRGISWGVFDKIVSENREPVSALQKHQLQRASIRQANPGATETYIQASTRTREKTPFNERVKELTDAYKGHAFIGEGMIRSMIGSNPANPHEALSKLVERVEHATTIFDDDQAITSADIVRYARSHRSNDKLVDALTLFKNNMAALEQKYADDPEFTPSLIRKISDRHLNGAVAAAERYKTCLDTLVAASDGSVPRTELQRSARDGITSFRDARRGYVERRINNRFIRRREAQRPSVHIIERITYLYPHTEVETVAENTHSLMNKGVVVSANADAAILHGNIPEDLYKVFSPKANEYLTFSSTVRGLSHLQRLVIAHEHGLMPLTYGCEANSLQLESLLNGKTITEYYYSTVVPLIAERTDDAVQALSLSEIANDLTYYKQSLRTRDLDAPSEVLSLRNARDATIVVGGRAVYLSEPGYEWNWDASRPDLYPWLEQKIISVCAPHQREAAFEHARDAIQTGVLELLGDTPQDYRLVFNANFYKDDITDLERAALANAMGIDQLLFGSNLGTLLRQHLGDQSLSITISRASSPNTVEISKDQLVQTAKREAEDKAHAEAELLPIPDDPFERLLTFIYGPQPNLAALSERERLKMTKTLFSVFSAHMQGAREHGETRFENQQDIFMAWSALEANDLGRAANTYGLAHNQIDGAIDRGLEVISRVFAELQNQRLDDIRAKLERIGTFPSPDLSAIPEEIPAQQPTDEAVPATVESASENVIIIDNYRHKAVHAVVGTVALQQEQVVVVEPEIKPQRATVQISAHDDETIERTKESDISDSVLRQYMAIAQQYPRLSMEEEQSCGIAIQAGIAARSALNEGAIAAHEKATYEQRVTDGEAAKIRLVHSGLQLVVYIARQYPEHPAISTADYIQEGNIGLLKAAERYKPEAQARFSSYAISYIKKYMGLARDNLGHAASVEGFAARNASRYRLFEANFENEHGRRPTQEEALKRFKWSKNQYEKAMQINIAPISLNQPVQSNDGSTSEIGDLLLAEEADDLLFEHLARRKILGHVIRNTFGDSPGERKQAATLTLMAGLELHPEVIDSSTATKHNIEEGREYTMREIASFLGFSHQSVERYRRQALEALSQAAVKDQLAYLLDEAEVSYRAKKQ